MANGLGPEVTYGSQSTFVLRLSDDRYLAMLDLWNPTDFIDSRYLWLPVVVTSDGYEIHWAPEVAEG